MKKTITLLLIVVCSFLKTKAQQYTAFPDSAAEWTVYYVGTCVNGGIPDTSITKYSLNGDTVINGTIFHKLTSVSSNFTAGFSPNIVAIREDNKKIYSTPNNNLNDSLLYDFNAGTGDSVYVFTGALKHMVSKVDSIQVGTSYRRRLHVGISPYGGADEYWIEGIGSTIGLATNTIPLPTCGTHYYELICFKQNGIVKYLSPNFESCNATKPKTATAITETGKYNTLKIFPNPTFSKQLHIDDINPYDELLAKVTDYTGKIVLSQKLNSAHNILQLPGTASLYILMIINKQGAVVLSQKILSR